MLEFIETFVVAWGVARDITEKRKEHSEHMRETERIKFANEIGKYLIETGEELIHINKKK